MTERSFRKKMSGFRAWLGVEDSSEIGEKVYRLKLMITPANPVYMCAVEEEDK